MSPGPRRIYRDYKPAAYWALPERDHDADRQHLEAIRQANAGKGFPFYPRTAL